LDGTAPAANTVLRRADAARSAEYGPKKRQAAKLYHTKGNPELVEREGVSNNTTRNLWGKEWVHRMGSRQFEKKRKGAGQTHPIEGTLQGFRLPVRVWKKENRGGAVEAMEKKNSPKTQGTHVQTEITGRKHAERPGCTLEDNQNGAPS